MTIQCNKISLGEFNSFEYLCTVVKTSPGIFLVTIYRPPKNCAHFIDDFSELLSIICTDFSSFILTGDFNIHIDNLNDNPAKEFCALLDTFELLQHVTGPTHTRGHTLDLVISKGLSLPVVNVRDLALSDHFCIFFDALVSPVIHARTKTVKKRYINEDTSALFMKALSNSPITKAESVDDFLNHFNLRILRIMDVLAPVKTKIISGKQKAPWRNASTVAYLKKECRKESEDGEKLNF
ncbi:hypothetical protein LDENG_00151480 [Lucifuga dentata]|nr:hypothetical protein LDENG_00151480 [Lucifuga dentata]